MSGSLQITLTLTSSNENGPNVVTGYVAAETEHALEALINESQFLKLAEEDGSTKKWCNIAHVSEVRIKDGESRGARII